MTLAKVAEAIVVAVLVLGVAVAIGFAARVAFLRKRGTSVIVRRLPNAPGEGWRHGIIIYRESVISYYRLTSLRIGPSLNLLRQGISVGPRRSPSGDEFDIMTDGNTIIEILDGSIRAEVALDDASLTAFIAWIESRPDARRHLRR